MSERYYTTHTFSTNSNHLRLERTYLTVAAAGTFHKLDTVAAAEQNSLVAVQTDFVELQYVVADTCPSAVVVQIDFVVAAVYRKVDSLANSTSPTYLTIAATLLSSCAALSGFFLLLYHPCRLHHLSRSSTSTTPPAPWPGMATPRAC